MTSWGTTTRSIPWWPRLLPPRWSTGADQTSSAHTTAGAASLDEPVRARVVYTSDARRRITRCTSARRVEPGGSMTSVPAPAFTVGKVVPIGRQSDVVYYDPHRDLVVLGT